MMTTAMFMMYDDNDHGPGGVGDCDGDHVTDDIIYDRILELKENIPLTKWPSKLLTYFALVD